MSECVYIICAHSDDQILGPGGTAAKYAKEGIHVHTIILSYGEFSHPLMQGRVTTKTRVLEAKRVDKIIGGKGVIFLGLKEGSFIKDAQEKKFVSKLRKMLDEKKPSKIFTHSVNDPLPDHQATLQIVKKIVRKMEHQPDVYSFPIWNIISIRKRNEPKLIVDISSTFKIKMKALMTFKSQRLSIYELMPGVILRNFLMGLNYNMKFAEVFNRIEIHEK